MDIFFFMAFMHEFDAVPHEIEIKKVITSEDGHTNYNVDSVMLC